MNKKKQLPSVTLLGVDCVDIDRLLIAAEICQKEFEFGEVKMLSSIPSGNMNIVKINPIMTRKICGMVNSVSMVFGGLISQSGEKIILSM